MALPLLVGVAVGSLAVVIYNNKRDLKNKVSSCASKAKDIAKTSFEKTKDFAKDTKESVQDKLCSKKEEIEVAK